MKWFRSHLYGNSVQCQTKPLVRNIRTNIPFQEIQKSSWSEPYFVFFLWFHDFTISVSSQQILLFIFISRISCRESVDKLYIYIQKHNCKRNFIAISFNINSLHNRVGYCFLCDIHVQLATGCSPKVNNPVRQLVHSKFTWVSTTSVALRW